MGRRKQGKPKRQRGAGEYTLQQLRPPGYDEWMVLTPDAAAQAAADPRLSPEAVDMARRLARLRPQYGPQIPRQALLLDLAVDHGALPLRSPGGALHHLPVGELAALLGADPADPADPAGADVRTALHELHASGALLVESSADPDAETVLRVVVGKPTRPGDPWLFGGDMESAMVPRTCIPGDPCSLGVEEFAALGYLRAHLSEGTVGTVEEYATFNGVGSVERAQALFDAVADLVDVRGCPACPTAHLCTRDAQGEADPAS
jgi:hypothetical protein